MKYNEFMNNIKTPEELLNFMSSNIRYGYLGKNGRVYHCDDSDFNLDWYEQYILEKPDDLLQNLVGNCWEQVELERAWFLNHGYNVRTIYEMVLLDYENDYPSHSFLVYQNNYYWYWFENADFNNQGIHKYSSFEELINDQYNKYINYLKKFNIAEEELKKIIITEFNTPKGHINAESYLHLVINSKYIDFLKGNKKDESR